MRIKAAFYVILILMFCAGPALMLAAEPDMQASFSVLLHMDKNAFNENEKPVLNIRIINTSTFSQHFIICEKGREQYSTFQPLVYDMAGREQEIIVPYRLENRSLAEHLSETDERRFELFPGEILVYPVNLKEIYNLNKAQTYRVKLFFYPDIKQSPKICLASNELTFTINPGIVPAENPVTHARAVTPSEIVLLHLSAEKNGNTADMLKYIDLESYINSYSEYAKRYKTASSADKNRVLAEFRNFLASARDDYLLDFKIIGSESTGDDTAFVDSTVNRYGIKYYDRYRYRHYLKKSNDLWLITDLEASVLKGVKR